MIWLPLFAAVVLAVLVELFMHDDAIGLFLF